MDRDEYLKNAEAAEARAREISDPDTRRRFEELAASWREMARRAVDLRRWRKGLGE
jgi:hypothetical protein